MGNLLIETKESYYKYISKVEAGCLMIANQLRVGNMSEAFSGIMNLAEGIQWLLSVEQLMQENGFSINSRIKEANNYLKDINQALENGDYVQVADLFEYEIQEIFSSASEWVFQKINQ